MALTKVAAGVSGATNRSRLGAAFDLIDAHETALPGKASASGLAAAESDIDALQAGKAAQAEFVVVQADVADAKGRIASLIGADFDRPGDSPTLYSATVIGPPENAAAYGGGSVSSHEKYGRVLRVPGGISIGQILRYPVWPGVPLQINALMRRAGVSGDTYDAVRVRVAQLDAGFARVAADLTLSESSPSLNATQSVTATVSDTAGDGITLLSPLARYLTIYWELQNEATTNDLVYLRVRPLIEVPTAEQLAQIAAAVAAATGAAGQIAALTSQVETAIALSSAGVRWISEIIEARSTGNVDLANGLENGDTLNGVTVETGKHYFIGSQTDPAENGIYTAVASGAASRATFADSAAELAHIGFALAGGTVGADEGWTLPLAAGDIDLGTTALNFARVPGGRLTDVYQATEDDPFAVENDPDKRTLARYNLLKGFDLGTVTLQQITTAFFEMAEEMRRYYAFTAEGIETPYYHLRGTPDAIADIEESRGLIPFRVGKDGRLYSSDTKRLDKLFTPGTVLQVQSGAPRPDGADVLAEIDGSHLSRAMLVVARDPGMTDIIWRGTTMPVAHAMSPVSYWRTAKWQVRGLEPDTRYWGTVYVDGVADAEGTLTFRTRPADGVAAAYSFWVFSCSRGTINPYMPILDYAASTVLTDEPLYAVHLGDLTYCDIDANDPYRFNTRIFREFRSYQSGAVLVRAMAMVNTHDDHERPGPENAVFESVMGDGSDMADALVAWRASLREQGLYYPFLQQQAGETDPDKIILAQAWSVGKVKNIMPDCMSQRTLVEPPTMLGTGSNPTGSWDQLQAIKDELTAAASEGHQLINLFLSPTVATGTVGGSFGYWFTAERELLYDHILDLPVAVIIWAGDLHATFADDGVSTAYDADGHAGIPLVTSSAVLSGTSGNPGTKKWLGVDSMFSGTQFGVLADVFASGGNITGYQFRIYGEPFTGIVPTLLGTYSTEDADREIEFVETAMDVSADSTVDIDVAKHFLGIGPSSATWTAEGGQTGTVEFGPNRRIKPISVNTPSSGTRAVTLSAPSGAVLGTNTVITLTVA